MPNQNPSLYRLATAGLASLICLQTHAAEGFLAGSHASLKALNYYFNQDLRSGSGQSKKDEWAQGFILDFQSGYTPGTLGVGVDALGLFGIKLDSSPDRTGTGLLPTHDDGRAPDDYGQVGLTAKFKVSSTELKVGTLIPKLPALYPNDTRLLPQTFRGAQLTSTDLAGLTFTGGRLNATKKRESSDFQDMALTIKNRRFSTAPTGDHFDFVGGDYRINESLTGRYHYAQLEDVYRQHFLGLLVNHRLGPGQFNADLRLVSSEEQGEARVGQVDNRAVNGVVSYAQGAQKFSVAYQKMSGDDGFPYIDGTIPSLVNMVQINSFSDRDETSWQIRHDFDFAGVGLPGLSLMNRYIRGKGSKVAGVTDNGREFERDTDVTYVIQSGSLKGLALRLRNATYRSDYGRDADETRLMIIYSFGLF